MSIDVTPSIVERPTTRVELARQLLVHVDRLEAALGTIPLAAEIQLLKRALARGHDVLRHRPEDNNFRSVVVLVELALPNLTPKQYTPEILALLREAFAAGVRPEPLAFEDYEAVRARFRERDVTIGPTLDLDALTPEDLDDGEEG